MEKILKIENKYEFESSVKIIPYKYIPETISEYSKDISIIQEIILKEEDENVLKLCKQVKNNLTTKLNFLKLKLEKIPNKKYLEESDEDYVDKYL